MYPPSLKSIYYLSASLVKFETKPVLIIISKAICSNSYDVVLFLQSSKALKEKDNNNL